MADMEVYFRHPTTLERRRARVDDTMTVQEVIDDLISTGFLQDTRDGYTLARKDRGQNGQMIEPDRALRSAGVTDGDTLNVLPATRAATEISCN